MVSTNGAVYAAGRTDKWLLISYEADGNRSRIGYVEIGKIKGNIPDVPMLQFANTPAVISNACIMTDDPFMSRDAIIRLEAGQEVTYLSTMDGWVYIEVTASKQTIRGFVPRECIVIQNGREAAIGNVSASDYIYESKEKDGWHPSRAVDGKLNTCWQIKLDLAGNIRNVYYTIVLAEPYDVGSLFIWNGFWKTTDNKDQYDRNARMKDIEISFLYAGESEYLDPMTVTLPETRDWKKREAGCAVDLNGHSYVKAIRIRLLDYYEGSHYPTDMCVSEFKVYGTASGR